MIKSEPFKSNSIIELSKLITDFILKNQGSIISLSLSSVETDMRVSHYAILLWKQWMN